MWPSYSKTELTLCLQSDTTGFNNPRFHQGRSFLVAKSFLSLTGDGDTHRNIIKFVKGFKCKTELLIN